MKTKTVINPKFQNLANFINEVAANGVPDDAENIYAGRNQIHRIYIDGINLNIKAFHCPRFPNNYIYSNLRTSKARRSFEFGMEIRRRGIGTPEPVAYIEKKDGGRLVESYYICLQSEATRNMRFWEKWAPEESDRIVKALARYMAQVHDAGILHHDFSPGNILWRETADGTIEFDMVDLNRMTILDRSLTLDERFSNFRNINYYEPGTIQLGREYGPFAGLDAEEAGQRALGVLRAEKLRKKRLHALKKIFKH